MAVGMHISAALWHSRIAHYEAMLLSQPEAYLWLPLTSYTREATISSVSSIRSL